MEESIAKMLVAILHVCAALHDKLLSVIVNVVCVCLYKLSWGYMLLKLPLLLGASCVVLILIHIL